MSDYSTRRAIDLCLEQGTPEWLSMRRNYIGASDAPVIMDVSPWKTKVQLWEEKLGLCEDQKDNIYMANGRKFESIARDMYVLLTGNEVKPKVMFHPTIEYMMASLDGITEDEKIAVEIKCPGEKDHKTACDGLIPEKYYPQLQHQLAVTGLSKMHYFSFRDKDYKLIEVIRDEEYINELYISEEKFWKCVQMCTQPDLAEFEIREDDEWMKLTNNLKDITKQFNELKIKEEEMKNLIIKSANNKSCFGNSIKLKRNNKNGSTGVKWEWKYEF